MCKSVWGPYSRRYRRCCAPRRQTMLKLVKVAEHDNRSVKSPTWTLFLLASAEVSHTLTPWLLHLLNPSYPLPQLLPSHPAAFIPPSQHHSALHSIPVQTLLGAAGTKHRWIMAVKCHHFFMAAASSPRSPPEPSPKLTINQLAEHLNVEQWTERGRAWWVMQVQTVGDSSTIDDRCR